MSEHPEYIRGVKDCLMAAAKCMVDVTDRETSLRAMAICDCQHAINTLLYPKPDHAKAAVEAFRTWRDRAVADGVRVVVDQDEALARWLEQQGVDLSRWGE